MTERFEIPSGDNQVYCQKWEEIERGWGERPDGFSLHVSLESLVRLIRECRAEKVTGEWSRPDSDHYMVGVDDGTYSELAENGGYRWYDRRYVYPANGGGVGGWQDRHPDA